jgi:hypothetical protein
MEQLDYNLLYRWFVGLPPDGPVWDPTTFTKNRDRGLRQVHDQEMILLSPTPAAASETSAFNRIRALSRRRAPSAISFTRGLWGSYGSACGEC